MANKKKQPPHPCDGCGKDKKQCKSCEHAEARALMLADLERMQRGNRIEMLTDSLPYNREVYINHSKFLLKQTAESMLIIGKILLAIREKEGYGEFVKICEEEIGIPHTTAYRFMNAAFKAEKFSAINFSQLGKVSHIYALLEASEEDLKEFENKGILAGKDMDELNRLSVKEMKDLIRKLKSERESIAKGIEEEMQAEKKALVNENKRLSAFEPQDPDKAIIEIFKQVDDHLEEIDKLLRHFVKIPVQEVQGDTISKIEGIYKRIQDRIELWHINWAGQLMGKE